MEKRVDVAVIGAGTAGRNALRQVARAQKSFVLINGGPMGTTCARVGCMPSKVAIQAAEDFHRRHVFERIGVRGGSGLTLDRPATLEHVRKMRDFFVSRTLEGTETLHQGHFIDGYAQLVEPTVVRVGDTTVRADAVVIATGSTAMVPEAWRGLGDRILTSDSFFEQTDFPDRMAVIGLGVVGLELGQTLARMNVTVEGFDALPHVGGLTDPEVAKAAVEAIGEDMTIHLGAPVRLDEAGDGVRVSAGEHSVVVDRVLVAVGRRPNLEGLDLARFGAEVDEHGVPRCDPATMQVGGLPIFVAGDLCGERALLHEATDEGQIAGINASRETPQRFHRKTPLAITFTDPNIGRVGMSWKEATAAGAVVGAQSFARQARSRVMGRARGLGRVYADPASGRLLGAEVAAPAGEHLAHLLAWGIEAGQTAFDLLRMPYYHPVVEEGLQGALMDLASKITNPPEGPPGLRPM